ncbi:MAG: DNA polymerase III subunit alpha [Candidatus Omnitrophica bacterium]|nr:DNA polymerase III subunit alpha [Candidatus Omnitrophota bacterium]
MSQTQQFIHLHVHTQYSLLDGACRVGELLDLARDYGMPSVAITDHGNMFGAIDFYEKARSRGIKPIIGCEVYVAPESRFDKTSHGLGGASFHLVLLARNMTGYHNLMELVSIGYLEGFYYKPRVDKEVLRKHAKGLIALSACLGGEVPHYILSDRMDEARRAALEYSEIFGKDNFYLEIQDNRLEKQELLNRRMVDLAAGTGLPLVATCDVHYLDKNDARAHEALLCVQTQTTLDDSDRMQFETDHLYFKSPEEMVKAFSFAPEAVRNTLKIAERCDIQMDFSEIHLPRFEPPGGKDNFAFFRELVDEGIQKRYGSATGEISERVEHEVKVIKDLGFVSYFLIVWDFINHAKSKGIPVGPGRGSAAGSIVSYSLGITDIDPIEYGLIFERFLNPSRVSMPDIDIDFCFERRAEVIDYVVEKYSKDNVAQIITFGSMMAKGVIRDVGRVMGMQYADVDVIAKLIPNDPGITLKKALEIEPDLRNRYEQDGMVKQLIDISLRLEGLHRHAGKHAAGVVISDKPLKKRIPLFKTSDDQLTTGYSMKSLDKIGMLKMDFLGLKTLTVIDQTVKIAKRTKGVEIDIDNIPLDDPKTFELLSRGETSGVFQVESGGMRDLLRKICPSSVNDLIAILALYRPGPMEGGMLDDFIRRKQGKVEVKYDHELLEPILKETYGIIVYQEQVMKAVSALAGFSMADADKVRKVMGKKVKDPSVLDKIKTQFLEGARDKKVDVSTAERIWDLIVKFAGYGFNKSHSAAYALISYRTAYLKANFPVEFMTALLTSEKNNSDKISDYINESLRMGIDVMPPDINASFKNFTVDGDNIRFGLSAVKNVGEGAAESMIHVRKEEGSFESLFDFAHKIDQRGVNRKVMESLIKCGAFDSTGIRRSQAMAVLDKVLDMSAKAGRDRALGQMSFFDDDSADESFKETFEELPDIPEWPEQELLTSEKEMLGFYITTHPLARFEKLLNAYSTCKVKELAGLSDGAGVLIGGIINKVRTTVTRKKGEKMAIMSMADLDNFVEVLVFPRAYRKAPELIKEDNLVYVHGKLNLREEEPKIVAEDIMPLEKVKEMFTRSVLLKLSTTGLEDRMMHRIKSAINRHKGNIPVYVDLLSPEGRKIRLSTDKDLSVRPTDRLVEELEPIIGTGNVKFLTK